MCLTEDDRFKSSGFIWENILSRSAAGAICGRSRMLSEALWVDSASAPLSGTSNLGSCRICRGDRTTSVSVVNLSRFFGALGGQPCVKAGVEPWNRFKGMKSHLNLLNLLFVNPSSWLFSHIFVFFSHLPRPFLGLHFFPFTPCTSLRMGKLNFLSMDFAIVADRRVPLPIDDKTNS